MPTFDTPVPIEVHIDIVGDARVTASDRSDTVVIVRPRDADKPGDRTAAEDTVVEFADGRLRVAMPKRWRRFTSSGAGDAVEVSIELPTGSRVDAGTGLGDLRTDGELARCRMKSAMGDIRVDHSADLRATTGHGEVTVDSVAGDLEVRTGSGEVRVGRVTGTTTIKNSNGDSSIEDAGGAVRVKASNGDVVIGRAQTSVSARSANGDIRVLDVRGGSIDLQTAVGELEIGVQRGVAAWLDLHSRFGSVRNSLEATAGPGESSRTVEVRAQTSAGDILVGRAGARS